MPTACNYSWPDELDAIIREEAAAAEAPLDLAYTFIAFESGFNVLARNLNPPIEDSVGLLQLNRIGGQGVGYTVEQLQDPRLNLRVGLPPIARSYAAAWHPERPPYEFLYLVATNSGHPGAIPRNDPRIRRAFNIWACFNSGVGWAGPGGAPAPAFAIGPGAALASSMAAFTLIFMFPGGLIRNIVYQLSPRGMVRQITGAFTLTYWRKRFTAAFDPRRLDPTRRLLRIFSSDIRLPPGHRPPRGFGPHRR